MNTVRWGILGAGNIAKQQALAMKVAENTEFVAVGSRSLEKAQAFAEEFGPARAYGSYEELVADPELDAVYVASPHSGHCEHTLLCLDAGKHVLCEKPFAINAGEARRMVEAARAKELFLMEAFWTRYFPAMVQVRQWLSEGAIGPVRVVTADFGFRAGYDPEGRLFSPKLGGGALLDVGVYAANFASMVMGKPDRAASLMQPAPTGVDGQSAFILSKEDTMAVLYTTVCATTPWEAVVLGESGRIVIDSPFWKPSRVTLTVNGADPVVYERAYPGNGYQFQLEEVAQCLTLGATESDVMSLAETVEIMETMDDLRADWGLRYPME